MRSTSLACAAAVTVCLFAIEARAADAPSYETLVAKAEADGLGVDYTALRQAYATSDHADPWGLSARRNVGPMLAAVKASKCDESLSQSEEVLKASFINVLAHMVRSICFGQKGELARQAREDTIVSGLRDSIFQSGDGNSEKTALVVVTLDEEQFVLSTKGLQEKEQALLRDAGHSYDMITAVSNDGRTQAVYFQIDTITAAEAKMLLEKR